MNHYKKEKNILAILFICITFVNGFAQDPLGPGNDPGAEPPAPINDWLIPMAIVGVVLIFYFFKKMQHVPKQF